MITLSCTRLASTKLSSSCIRLASTKISFPKLINVQEVVYDQQNWKDLFEKQEPILFKGINKNWKACNSWSDVDYLKAKVKSSSKNQAVIVPVECGDNYMDEELQILHLDFIELLDFFDKKDITNVPTLYLAQTDIKEIPGLIEDIKVPEITKTGSGCVYRSNIWLGGTSGTSSPCHNDPFNNFLCQIYGNKKVILFPPTAKEYLYMNDPHHKQKNTSRIDFKNPIDYRKFPLFLDAPNGIVVNLEPSDALFIPLKWFHYCETRDKSCSVNYWWL